MKFENLKGWVQQLIHHSGDFYVFRFLVEESGAVITARGSLYGLFQVQPGAPLELVGSWRKHAKYGKQFSIRSWLPWAKRPDDVSKFLSLCVDGFSREMAEDVATIGLSAYEKLSKGYETVARELFVDEDWPELQKAILGWQRSIAVRDLSVLLRTGGLTAMDIQFAMARFGMEAPAIIQGNPYRLMEVIPDFPKVDKLAIQMGFDTDDPHRLEGAILWAVREEGRQGHLFVPRGNISTALDGLIKRNTLLALPDASVDDAVHRLVDDRALVLEPGVGVYLPDHYLYERKAAEYLGTFLSSSNIDFDVDAFLEAYEKSNRIKLSKSQQAAVKSLSNRKVLVLTGLPGTGKTTAVRAIVKLFENARMTYALMAPTGIAAKRLAAVTSRNASTVHRALGYDGDKWRNHEDNRYIVDAVIVDEMSMVDQELFYRLLSSLRPETFLVFVGDDAQLPSVGPGNVLRELVASGVPHVRLTQIFRQSEKGEIVTNSHRINRGEAPILVGPKEKSEFKFVHLNDEDRIVDLIVSMAAKLKGRDANFQVLSPKYEGVIGVNQLNEALREKLNPPGPQEWKWGSSRFRLGDRLMVVQNDYQRSVYNGDMGKLVEIRREELVVRIHGVGPNDPDLRVAFPYDIAADRLKLAYAISVHKSQGSEFDTIILPVVRSQGRMLQRNLLYTAVTRARKRVWVLGTEDAVRQAVSNNQVIRRNTVLAEAIGVQMAHDGRRTDSGAESTPSEAAV